MKDILILGHGGFAKEVAFLIDSINIQSKQWNLQGYISKDKSEIGKKHGKYSIYNCDEWLLNSTEPLNIVIGIGDPGINAAIISKLKTKSNLRFPNLIHPNVIGDWEQIKIGIGNVICASNIFTIDIEIGSFNAFNPACTIGHDSIIGDFNIFNYSVNISGGVNLGNMNLIGTGSVILQLLTIGDNNKIGAGAVVTKDITESGTYAGIPARRIM